MKNKLYNLALILLVCSLSSISFAQQKIAVVGHEENRPCDTLMVFGLKNLGYDVTWITRNDYSANFTSAASYSAYDLMMFSETTGSGDSHPFKTAGFPIPCINLEGWALKTGDRWDIIPTNKEGDHFLQAGNAAVDTGVNTIVITNSNHPIGDKFGKDYELKWSSSTDTEGVSGFNLSDHVLGAVAIGTYHLSEFDNFSSVWAFPKGSTILSDQTTIASNTVVIGSIETGMAGATDEFFTFLDECIKWATDAPAGIEDNLQPANISAYPNPTSGILNIGLSAPLSGNVIVNLYDISGRFVKTIGSDGLVISEEMISIDISELAEAQYIFQLVTENDVLGGTIIKQ